MVRHLIGRTFMQVSVPQSFLLGILLFLIRINYMAENLSPNPKLFADGTFWFFVVCDLNASAHEIIGDLKKIKVWNDQWKLSLNLDPLRQAHKVIFSQKRTKPYHSDIVFKSNLVKKAQAKIIWEYFLIVKLILMNVLFYYLIKLVNL